MASTPSPAIDEILTHAPEAASRVKAASRATWRRQTAMAARWLHIYGSMISLAVVLFFSATGLMLNHPQWFAGAERVRELAGSLDRSWVAGDDTAVDRLRIVESLRATHGITGAVADFRVDGPDMSIAFKGPGYAADAFVDRATGHYTLTETRLGLAAIVGDLHKGRDSGGAWSAVIDVSAALLCFVSFSGLLLLYFLHRHRTAGALLVALGGLATYAVYAILVP